MYKKKCKITKLLYESEQHAPKVMEMENLTIQ